MSNIKKDSTEISNKNFAESTDKESVESADKDSPESADKKSPESADKKSPENTNSGKPKNAFKDFFSRIFGKEDKKNNEVCESTDKPKKSLETLQPRILKEDEDAYNIVKQLDDILTQSEKEDIRNIALTGPFGSGKSSVLNTLEKNFNKKRSYLKISLATLQANNEQSKLDKQSEQEDLSLDSQGGDQSNEDKETADKINSKLDEALNRQIEYSILQQLIYREKACTVPNSRISRIIHHDSKKLFIYALCSVITVIAFFIVFVPTIASTLSHNLLNESNVITLILEIISRIWLVFALYKIFHYIYKTYGNSKLNKLNFKDGTIEVGEDTSIFNKHLDEILYFFQVTDYDVVIIEDLDRFDSPNIFLKLRELNFIINESKIVNRHITFIYAIKDDMFKDEDRTKFFDYIIPIIPIINPSNADALLKRELSARGFKDDINDDDLTEIAFFIHDMRILINILNEYEQYRTRLCGNGQSLNYAKLLAMITYKNYYPNDFSELHQGKGDIYKCFDKKKDIITEALKDCLKERNKLIKDKESSLFNEKELRILFLHRLCDKYDRQIYKIEVDNKYYTLYEIGENENLFKILYNSSPLSCKDFKDSPLCSPGHGFDVNVEQIDKEIHYTERIKALKTKDIDEKLRKLQEDSINIKSLGLKALIANYPSSNSVYTSLNLKPMLDIFIREGLVDEDYYDYISYFYPEMISPNDYKLLTEIKQQKNSEQYDQPIIQKENFVKLLKDHLFNNDSILINDLLDYLMEVERHKDKLELFIQHLINSQKFIPFLNQYCIKGKHSDEVFQYIMELNKDRLWKQIKGSKQSEEYLYAEYLKFCGELNKDQQKWLNSQYILLAEHEDAIGYSRCIELIESSKFKSIDSKNQELINYVRDHNCYEINLGNLLVVAKTIGIDSFTKDNLNISRLFEKENENFKNYVEKNINDVLKCLNDKDKDEIPDVLLYIINNDDIEKQVKDGYLEKQKNKIENIKEIQDKNNYDFVINKNLLKPTWENVSRYFNYKGDKLTDNLTKYLEINANELSHQNCDDSLPNVATRIFNDLFLHNEITLKNYTLLLKSFRNRNVKNTAGLQQLDTNHLLVLVENDKIPFDTNFVNTMGKTNAYAEYLIHHHVTFISALQSKRPIIYNITKEVAIKILQSKELSDEEKLEVTKIINKEIKKDGELADILVDIYNKTDFLNENNEVVHAILNNAKKRDKVLNLATKMIKVAPNEVAIKNILTALGGDYADMISKKDIDVKAQTGTKNLLDALKQAKYISSYEDINIKGRGKYYCVHF